MAFYADTSALVKLVVAEDETDALRAWLIDEDRRLVAADIVRTELLRSVRRAVPDRIGRAREVLDALTLLQLRPTLCEFAGRIDPLELRSLDAIHLATALDLGDDLDAILTYDDRLASAASANGLAVVAPPQVSLPDP